jgi:ADP-ribosylglycohydrolase
VSAPGHEERLRGGLLGAAAGEALGLPWVGRAPREISVRRLYDGVGATGAVSATLLAGAGDGLAGAVALGWREDDAVARRRAALHLGFAPVLVADLAAWALARKPVYHLVADHADDWAPPFRGVARDDRAVVDALMAILHRHDDPADGMRSAVRLGGDATAELGGLVGAILGCRYPSAVAQLPWLERVDVPDDAALDRAVAGLRAKR